MLTLFCKNLDNTVNRIEISHTDSIKDLKNNLAKRMSINHENIRILHMGILCDDDSKVGTVHFK